MSASPETVAIIGAGTIGASWAALFLANGMNVQIYDLSENTRHTVHTFLTRAWPALQDLVSDAPEAPPIERAMFFDSPEEAVSGASFIQESTPEVLDQKHHVLSRIEQAMDPLAVVASSASGLTLSQMQQGMRHPGRLVLGHPFNPPHLIPLVELYANERTDPDALLLAQALYIPCGKTPITLKREVPGHVANRLQAALWREAVHLVVSGVASLEDVDKAVSAGPGLRWATAGPSMIFNLGAGHAGIGTFCERFGSSFHRWWDDLGDPRLDQVTVTALSAGLAQAAKGNSIADLEASRDRRLIALMKVLDGRYVLG